jgi:hypothetical protein
MALRLLPEVQARNLPLCCRKYFSVREQGTMIQVANGVTGFGRGK